MPTYQYACTAPECGNEFELVQSFTDPSVTECPTCGERVRKVYGAVGVVFKGSGFYRNDSRQGNKNGASGSSGSSPAKEKAGASAESGSGSGSKDAAKSTKSDSGSSSSGSSSSGSVAASA